MFSCFDVCLFADKKKKKKGIKVLPTSSLFNCLCLPVESRVSAVSVARTFVAFFVEEDMVLL